MYISPNGVFGVLPTTNSLGDHLQVYNRQTNTPIFTTFAKYQTINYFKYGEFSGDSNKFAVVYHYGDPTNYTWIGVWTTQGVYLGCVEKNGWVTDVTGAFGELPAPPVCASL